MISFETLLLVSYISSTALSASMVTVILFRPLSWLGSIGIFTLIESAYLMGSSVSRYATAMLWSGNCRLISTTIFLLGAFPRLRNLASTLKELSATEINPGVIFTMGSSTT